MSAPVLGFGCASLGSRISRGDGLAALARAYEVGVRWFDVAPSYGDGEAERLLGQFAQGRRESLTLVTKVGILPGAVSLPKRFARPLVRLALAAAPGLRAAVKRRRPVATKPPLTARMIADSIDASLGRLRTEQVDVLALHDSTSDEVAREDVLRALEAVVASGKAAKVGIASAPCAALAGLAASSAYRLVQVANNPLEPGLAALAPTLAAAPEVTAVTHSVFGAAGLIEEVADRIVARPALAAAFRDAGYAGTPRVTALAFLPDHAFVTNPDGVVLLSMFSRRHLEANLARAAATRDAATVRRLGQLVGAPA